MVAHCQAAGAGGRGLHRSRPSHASEEWLDALVRRVELLRDLAEQGRVVPEWHESSVREVLHEPYRIIYEVFTDHIDILTLSHIRQQLPTEPLRRG